MNITLLKKKWEAMHKENIKSLVTLCWKRNYDRYAELKMCESAENYKKEKKTIKWNMKRLEAHHLFNHVCFSDLKMMGKEVKEELQCEKG